MLECRPAQTEDRITNVPVYLPYKRNVVDTEVTCPVEGDFNYTPYDFFCLTTKLSEEIYDVFRQKLVINYETIRVNDEMVYSLMLYDGSGIVPISEESSSLLGKLISRKIADSPRHCNLFTIKHNYDGIPNEFIRTIAPWYPFEETLDVTISEDQILIDLFDVIDFKKEYGRIFLAFDEWIHKAYSEGWIYKPSENFVKNWQLTQVDGDIYKPEWTDVRFAPDKYKFLTRKNDFIELEYPNNMNNVNLYQICKILITHGYRFCHFVDFSKLIVEAKTLAECMLVANIFDYGLYVDSPQNCSYIPINTYQREPVIVHELIRQGMYSPQKNMIVIPASDKNYPFVGLSLLPYGYPEVTKEEFMRVLITPAPVKG